jgi:D-inositol-3-phosphate glycosyltransferase
VVAEAERLIASTAEEAGQLVELYGADPARVRTIAPGVDLDVFVPGSQAAARSALGLRPGVPTVLFVGRIQALKAPDVLLRAAAVLRTAISDLQVVVVGGPSGSRATSQWLTSLAGDLDLGATVRFVAPAPQRTVADYYRAADITVVPSYNESFGLVALESQACGTPVVAASVGGLPTAVANGRSGLLVSGHEPDQWAKELDGLLRNRRELARLAAGARAQAERFSWDRTTDGLLVAYREAVQEMDQREAVQEMDQREAVQEMDQREAVQEMDQREAVEERQL